MLMTDCTIEEPTVPESRAIIWGAHICVQCEDPCIAAPIPTRDGYKCGPCSIRSHILPFIVERLMKREVGRESACG